MAKESKESKENKPKETEIAGMKLSTWAKLINVCLGVGMVLFSVFSFFSIPTDVVDATPVLIVSFKIYEM